MTTRSQKPKSSPESPLKTNKRVESSWILLIKDGLFENSNFNIITLPHPAHGKPAKYALDHIHNKMYELVLFSEPYRSWFIDETVKSDGNLLLLTPVNPLFLVLPRLREQCSSRAVPLEDLLSEKDMKAYKYNEEKTLAWLEGRVKKLATVLREKNIHVTSGATSATFVASNIGNDNIDEEIYLKYAHGMVSEYLQDDLVELLEKKFHFKPDLIESIGKKRKSEATDISDPNKKVKQESNGVNGDSIDISINQSYTEVKKERPLSAKEKARQKAASGTKTISSFFTKK
ncbi:ribonuclease H2 subunit B isoform X2 [Galleria mellonella]|uniref:Ribonuclease H2 subunit B n=1 Tax=Galleria mellonella TaxID=7137 RepID=A0A6J1X3V0_GALME|nr:ribonuclease H2 subunit B isoform X2 [Galleria mellonella]